MSALKNMQVHVKDADLGTVEAVFSKFNVIDHDGDVTLPSAFEDGAPVRISAYNHGSSLGAALPVGKGRIKVGRDEAVMEGQFFLDTTHGRDTFAVVKHMGEIQEWSYAYDILDAEPGVQDSQRVQVLKSLRVNEVSPVLVGAGIGTRTLSAKGLTLAAQFDEVEALVDRLEEIYGLRAEKGKDLGADARKRAVALGERLTVLASKPPEQHTDNAKSLVEGLYARALVAGIIKE